MLPFLNRRCCRMEYVLCRSGQLSILVMLTVAFSLWAILFYIVLFTFYLKLEKPKEILPLKNAVNLSYLRDVFTQLSSTNVFFHSQKNNPSTSLQFDGFLSYTIDPSSTQYNNSSSNPYIYGREIWLEPQSVYKAALYYSKPWLPLHNAKMKAIHNEAYERLINCLHEYPGSTLQICKTKMYGLLRKQQPTNFTTRLQLFIEQRNNGVISFPDQWLQNYDKEELEISERLGQEYANKTIEAVKFIYKAYKDNAWGYDEIAPLTRSGGNWAGLGVQLIESMSTLYLMGLYEEFFESAEWVMKTFSKFNTCTQTTSFFELTIRVFGGLVSAAALSAHRGLLEVAEFLGRHYLLSMGLTTSLKCPWNIDKRDSWIRQTSDNINFQPVNEEGIHELTHENLQLFTCHNTNTSELLSWSPKALEKFTIPNPLIYVCRRQNKISSLRSFRASSLAQIGTFQMEFRALSMLTGDLRYKEVGDAVLRFIKKISKKAKYGYRFLPEMQIYSDFNSFSGGFSIGGESDSFVEYLIKCWLQSGKTESDLLALWNGAIDEVITSLYVPSSSYGAVVGIPRPPKISLPISAISQIKLENSSQTLADYLRKANILYARWSEESVELPLAVNKKMQEEQQNLVPKVWQQELVNIRKTTTKLPSLKQKSTNYSNHISGTQSFSLTPALIHLYQLSFQIGTPVYLALKLLHRHNPFLYRDPFKQIGTFPTPVSNSIDKRARLEHLACFLPGTIYLSVHNLWERLPLEIQSLLPSPMTSRETLQENLSTLISFIESTPETFIDSSIEETLRLLSQLELASSLEDTCLATYIESEFDLGFEITILTPTNSSEVFKILSKLEEAYHTGVQKQTEYVSETSSPTYPGKLNFIKQAKQHFAYENEEPAPDSTYALRPEAFESLYYIHYFTGDPKYRRLGARLYESIEKYLKGSGGFSAVYTNKKTITGLPLLQNKMETFFIAETLKYLFLLFSPPEVLDLNKFVFTTEGHPMPILKKGFGPSIKSSDIFNTLLHKNNDMQF